MSHAFSLRLMILRLSHSPLCHLITEFHTSLLFFHAITAGKKYTPPILIFLHLFSAFFIYCSLSLSNLCSFFLNPGGAGYLAEMYSPLYFYTHYVPEILFHTFEDTRIWGLSNHILAFYLAYGQPLTLVESLQPQMGFSLPFLRAKDLRLSLLNIKARSFLLSCT